MPDKTYRFYYSRDDTPLLFYETVDQLAVRTEPVITVENYSKWYRLYLVDTKGAVRPIAFDKLEMYAKRLGESPYCDHVPNPKAVALMCEKCGYDFHDLAQEAIIGRWEIEYLNHYKFQP